MKQNAVGRTNATNKLRAPKDKKEGTLSEHTQQQLFFSYFFVNSIKALSSAVMVSLPFSYGMISCISE